jgi:GNAT superfamily N-acetyltransferase
VSLGIHAARLSEGISAIRESILSLPSTGARAKITSMEIRIRAAGIEDLRHILHHRRAMFEEIGFRDAAVLDRVDRFSREYFEEALPAGAYKAWIAEDANRRVLGGGGIVISPWPGYPGENHAKRVWILNMYTEPEARRHGIAKRLVQAMIDWCRKEGFSAVSLHASDAGRPLYASLGFQPTNEMTLQLR